MSLVDNIFSYSVLIEYEPEQIVIANAIVTRNFGPFVVGESFALVSICYECMEIKAMNNKKEILKSCRMKLEPKSD